ncbi:MAG: hypothetical protein MUC87_09825 [Bacteroidia bacterium]|nr:hypothetical protein [Bacteroidia bacterium]
MRNLPFLAMVMALCLTVNVAAQSETRLPAVSELVFLDNVSVAEALNQPVKYCHSLKIGGAVDDNHLDKLVEYFTDIDSIFINGLYLTQLPASIEKSKARHLSIARCEKLDLTSACTRIGQMQALNSVSFIIPVLAELPATVRSLRHLEKISFINTDLSLTDGDALRHHLPGTLYSESRTTLGFRAPELGAAPLELVYGSYNSEVSALHLAQLSDYFQGVPGAVTKLASRNGKQFFNYMHPLIRRPISGTDVARNYYTFNVEKGASFSYPSGTNIRIPANAFVDKNGKPVSGEVTLGYREFRDAADIVVSGIPMKYDSAGQTADFESAGMFELVASSAGNEVKVAPGKNITMQFALTKPESSYNFYKLDENQGWVFQGKPGTPVNNTDRTQNLTVRTEAIAMYLRKWNEVPATIPDTTSFSARFESLKYMHNHYIVNKSIDTTSNRHTRIIRLSRVWGEAPYTCFKLSSASYELFPELKAYNGIIWMMNEKLSSEEFKKRYGKSIPFNDARITGGNGEYKIRLKYFKGIVEIPATACVRQNDKIHKIGAAAMAIRDAKYQKRSKQREEKFKDLIAQKMNDYQKALDYNKNVQQNAWKESVPLMNETEKNMNYDQWISYVDEFLRLQQKNYYQSANTRELINSSIIRELTISGTGIYNWDKANLLTNPAKILVKAKSIAGRVFPAIMAYVISKGKNMAMTFGTQSISDGILLNFSKTDSTKIVLVDAEGRVAVIPPATLAGTQNYIDGDTYHFNVAEMSDEPPALPELKSMLSLN